MHVLYHLGWKKYINARQLNDYIEGSGSEFVQTVTKGVDNTSTFCSQQYLHVSWTGLEGMLDGYTLNKSAYLCSFDF